MKNINFLFTAIFLLTGFIASSQKIEGAWQNTSDSKQTVLLYQDGYFTQTEYTSNGFLKTWGGPAKINDGRMNIFMEFNSADSNEVGKEKSVIVDVKDNKLLINENGSEKIYNRIDAGNAPLAGVWKISAREQEGKVVPIHQTGARKTLKMLSGNRFQWFAINPDTKQFSGTGGGTYTFTDGKYTENIEFFSRDNSRVGARLTFNGELKDSQWHHSGLSSKGDKIYEIWSRQKP
jgi:hypothetical protein